MKLDTFIRVNNIKMVQFAKLLKISLRALGYYRTGERDWPLSLAMKVEEITEGDVTVYDLAKLYNKK
jgi:predicted transcriptional regulator